MLLAMYNSLSTLFVATLSCNIKHSSSVQTLLGNWYASPINWNAVSTVWCFCGIDPRQRIGIYSLGLHGYCAEERVSSTIANTVIEFVENGVGVSTLMNDCSIILWVHVNTGFSKFTSVFFVISRDANCPIPESGVMQTQLQLQLWL